MLFLAPAELRGVDARGLEELLERRDCVVAFGDGDVRGIAAAALLFADYAVLCSTATLTIDSAEGWAGVVWRLGRGALPWSVTGQSARAIVDDVTDLGPERWREEWMRHRSVMALDSAAALLRMRGGDALERAEFARLFAIDEPQTGLRAFLAKTKPEF